MLYLIEYHEKFENHGVFLHRREEFDNARDFTKRYNEIKDKNELSTVNRFCFVECHFIHQMSSLKLKATLRKGEEPQSGYVLERRNGYVTHDSYVTRDINNALIMTKEEADAIFEKYKDDQLYMIKNIIPHTRKVA